MVDRIARWLRDEEAYAMSAFSGAAIGFAEPWSSTQCQHLVM